MRLRYSRLIIYFYSIVLALKIEVLPIHNAQQNLKASKYR
nr:MAG TPA: hypothetical protein [Caudoviricetes sp.]